MNTLAMPGFTAERRACGQASNKQANTDEHEKNSRHENGGFCCKKRTDQKTMRVI